MALSSVRPSARAPAGTVLVPTSEFSERGLVGDLFLVIRTFNAFYTLTKLVAIAPVEPERLAGFEDDENANEVVHGVYTSGTCAAPHNKVHVVPALNCMLLSKPCIRRLS